MNTGIVNIRGKEYQTVALRVQKFREAHPDWAIVTVIVSRDDTAVVMLASILNAEGRIIATGHAEENRKSSQINQTSALENCETSAIGRALAAAGFGGTEFASANEVQNAIHQQSSHSEILVNLIEESKNVEELKQNFKDAFTAAKSNAVIIAAITAAKDKRKAELAA